MIDLVTTADGVILPVRAQPGARTAGIRGIQNGALKVAVTQAPEKGKANKAILATLSKQLCLRKSQLEWITGQTSQDKRILVRDISVDELRAAIQRAAGDSGCDG